MPYDAIASDSDPSRAQTVSIAPAATADRALLAERMFSGAGGRVPAGALWTEGTSVDADRFDGLARSVADRGEEAPGDQEQFDTLTRLVARKGSRRLALAGLVGAVFLGHGAQPTAAGCNSKEGKNKRQCRRNERDDKAPGAGISFPCQDKLFGVCSVFNPDGNEPCCNGMHCTSTATIFLTACQFLCQTDDDCKRKFPNKALACREDLAVCPLEGKCCVPR